MGRECRGTAVLCRGSKGCPALIPTNKTPADHRLPNGQGVQRDSRPLPGFKGMSRFDSNQQDPRRSSCSRTGRECRRTAVPCRGSKGCPALIPTNKTPADHSAPEWAGSAEGQQSSAGVRKGCPLSINSITYPQTPEGGLRVALERHYCRLESWRAGAIAELPRAHTIAPSQVQWVTPTP